MMQNFISDEIFIHVVIFLSYSLIYDKLSNELLTWVLSYMKGRIEDYVYALVAQKKY